LKSLLIIFAKEPVPGQVKTRLTPPLSPADAARLYHLFLEDILEEMGPLPEIGLSLAYSPPAALNFFQRLAPPGVLLFPQEGPGLGERLANACHRGFGMGFRNVLVRNSDSPDLPGETVLAAAGALRSGQADLVLGPNPDGGYYLLGLNQCRPRLFQGICWSSPTVLPATLDLARDSSLSPLLLPSWPDIDTISDLRAFAGRPHPPQGPGRRSRAFARELLEAIPGGD
jgi:rSAM/selenodomain-associated transferase 1